MKNTTLKKLFSLSLSVVMLAGAVPARADATATTAMVSATAVNGGSFIINERSLAVSSDEAEKFGYTDNLSQGVSSLDVLVKMHELKFGEAFTPETAPEYFALSDAGWITRIFGGDSVNVAYSANHASTYDLYGEIPDGGSFELYFYQDLAYWSDIYAHIADITAAAGEETVINAYYSDYTLGNVPLKGAQLAYVNGLGIEPIEGAVADDDGNIKMTFDKPGTYYVTLTGKFSHEVTVDWTTYETALFDSPIIPSVTKVTVNLSSDTVMPDEVYARTAESLRQRELVYGEEWAVTGLARAGYKADNTYFESVAAAKKEMTKATDIERTIIALTAAGKTADSTLLDKLSSNKFVNTNGGIMSSVYALIALDAADYEIPQSADASDQNTRDAMIAGILAAQTPSGGFSFTPTYAPSVDITAMAVQALARYKDRSEVALSIEKALEFISTNIEKEEEYTPDKCSTLAQVIVAYTELGKNPQGYVKQILEYYDGNGRFLYNGRVNATSTEQAFYALAAYYRWANGENSLYDMTDASYSILSFDGESLVVNSPFNGDITVIGADYTKGALTGISAKTETLKKGNNTIAMNNRGQVMLWDSVNGMQPLCEVYTK